MNHTTRTPGLQLSLRKNGGGSDHHLWNNNGTWWCHFTVHTSDGRKHRVRRSLRTRQVDAARRRRDEVLMHLAALAA